MPDLISSLSSFTPQHFHWPTALLTAVAITAAYYINKGIKHLVGTTLATESPHRVIQTNTKPTATADKSSFPAASLLDFFLLIGRLKTTKRQGWVDHGVPSVESVSDHMYRLAVMMQVLQKETTSQSGQSGVVLALAHDMAESIVGDITPPNRSGVSKAEKAQRELAAMRQLTALLHPYSPTLEQQLFNAFSEYEDNDTSASRLLHDLDKAEMIIQAYEYEVAEKERQSQDKGSKSAVNSEQQSLSVFYDSIKSIKDERVLLLMEEVVKRRGQLMAESSAPNTS